MYKKIISFGVLFLVLLNIPSIVLKTQTIEISSPISYLAFFLLGMLIVTNKTKFPKQILFLAGIASLYYFIGAFQNEESFKNLLINYFKFLLYLFGLSISLQYINQKTIILLLLAGAITILLDSLYFRFNDFQGIGYVSEYGRYSGFYLNPNTAGVICLLGFVLTIVKKDVWKILSVFFSFLGFLTLSKTFMISWFLITIIYLFYNRKHIAKLFFIFVSAFLALFILSEKVNLNTDRFSFLTSLLSGSLDTEILNKNNRIDQWAKFYELIIDSPIFGNGYRSFLISLADINGQGVHNIFLLIFGESGFLPFLLFLALIIRLFYRTFTNIGHNIVIFFLTLLLFTTFLVSHNFFSSGIQIFIFTLIIYKKNEESYIKTI
tara:strand:- start:6651 stop:7784 length:1134 start_codon:yes stop_codon:yes gene_type:complete